MGIDLRQQPREIVELPVSMQDGGMGKTRDVSATGLYLEMEGTLGSGSVVDLSIELSLDERPIFLTARGQVVRVEIRDGRTGFALRLVESKLVDKQSS